MVFGARHGCVLGTGFAGYLVVLGGSPWGLSRLTGSFRTIALIFGDFGILALVGLEQILSLSTVRDGLASWTTSQERHLSGSQSKHSSSGQARIYRHYLRSLTRYCNNGSSSFRQGARPTCRTAEGYFRN